MPPPGSWVRVTSTVPIKQLQTGDLRCPPQPHVLTAGGGGREFWVSWETEELLRERQSRGICDLLERGAGGDQSEVSGWSQRWRWGWSW